MGPGGWGLLGTLGERAGGKGQEGRGEAWIQGKGMWVRGGEMAEGTDSSP